MSSRFGWIALVMAMGTVAQAADIPWRQLPLIVDGKVAPEWKQAGGGKLVVDGDAVRTEGDERGLGVAVFTPEKFGNCQIRAVYKTGKPKGNSGVHVRIADGILERLDDPAPPNLDAKAQQQAGDTEQHAWFAVHHGYEIQIEPTADRFHRTGSVYSLAGADDAPQIDPEGWRTMIITLDGSKIRVSLDGQQISEFDSAETNLPERTKWYEPLRTHVRPEVGYLALQVHGRNDVVWFKDVSVRPLPDSGK